MRGYPDRETAASLVISARTVSVHVSHILRKLGGPDRLEAAVTAHRLAPQPPVGDLERQPWSAAVSPSSLASHEGGDPCALATLVVVWFGRPGWDGTDWASIPGQACRIWRGRLAQDPGLLVVTSRVRQPCPYKSVARYGGDDAALFVGRERLVEDPMSVTCAGS